ncbi:MAG: dihydroorotase [Amylibacter sp.]|jgi:dihydroorotase|nr:dihydroorotase [Amylibacter sp.]|tara:strand:- start:983 stop:2260 length:1278 start_codon:yes stop_codon:yes gene_type:complete
MKTLFSNARIINPETLSDTLGSVLIENETITGVYNNNPSFDFKIDKVIDCEQNCLAPGIVDIGVKIGEPGERHKESFKSAGLAAANGGITTMVIRPDTDLTVDSPEILEFIYRRAVSDSIVKVLPMAALTKGRNGAEMAEIGFLKDAGAVAFTDCDQVITDNKVLLRCLTYAKGLNALIITHPQEPILSQDACATSGALATKLGLPSVSTFAELIQLQRDMSLIEMTNSKVHFDQVTCSDSIAALKQGKDKGLSISAGVSIHHLTLNEQDIEGYPTFFKVKPPLRNETDRIAAIEAVSSGTIDIISSMHTPQDEESKRLPFEASASGAVGLETLLPAALQLVHGDYMDLPTLWRALSLNPAKLLGLSTGRIKVGCPADLVLFDLDKPFILDRTKLHSKSKNTPFDGRTMQGRVIKTIVSGQEVHS